MTTSLWLCFWLSWYFEYHLLLSYIVSVKCGAHCLIPPDHHTCTSTGWPCWGGLCRGSWKMKHAWIWGLNVWEIEHPTSWFLYSFQGWASKYSYCRWWKANLWPYSKEWQTRQNMAKQELHSFNDEFWVERKANWMPLSITYCEILGINRPDS